ncbi:DUF5652 family protein [Chloroflexota bacterium]
MEPFGWVCPLFPNWLLFFLIIPVLAIWEAVWKGIALWRAGGNQHLAWFICIFIFNTLGILPIIYIFGFSKKKE